MCVVVSVGSGVKSSGLPIRRHLAPKTINKYAIAELQVYNILEFFENVDIVHGLGQSGHRF